MWRGRHRVGELKLRRILMLVFLPWTFGTGLALGFGNTPSREAMGA